MKKIFAILAAALVAFGMSSCKDNGNDPTDNSIKIEVSKVTSETASVTITPGDSKSTYVWAEIETKYLAKYTDAALIKEMKEDVVGVDPDDFEENPFCKGKTTHKLTELDPNTEYVVFAFYMDEKGNTPDDVKVYKSEPFRTLAE